VTRLHHLALGTADVERLAAFYREQLELQEVQRHHHESGALRSVWLDLGGSWLMIEQCDEPGSWVDERGAGLFLLALRVAPAQLAALTERLRAHGHPIEARTEYTAYLRDPDGNRVGLSHYPESSA